MTVSYERASRITPPGLTRWAGVAAVAAGLLFIGVQVNHPHLDATTITTTDVAIRNSLKVLMVVLTLVGITGMYLRQVKESGVLGLVGYLVLAAGYLLLLGTTFAGAFVLPAIAATDSGFVNDALAAASGRTPDGDIGVWATVMKLQGVGYLVGGLLFGIALFRARVLVRWATALLAVSGLITVALSVTTLAYGYGLSLDGAPTPRRSRVGGGWADAGRRRRGRGRRAEHG
jgi:hypothetical protein